MPVNIMPDDDRIETRFTKEVRTPLGDVLVTYSAVRGEVEVTFRESQRARVEHEFLEDGRETLMVFRTVRREPAVGDELTQDGRTFEVVAVDKSEDSGVRIKADNGDWLTWKGM